MAKNGHVKQREENAKKATFELSALKGTPT